MPGFFRFKMISEKRGMKSKRTEAAVWKKEESRFCGERAFVPPF